MFIAIPHVTSRASAISREPVIKAEIEGLWVELPTLEVSISLDNYKVNNVIELFNTIVYDTDTL